MFQKYFCGRRCSYWWTLELLYDCDVHLYEYSGTLMLIGGWFLTQVHESREKHFNATQSYRVFIAVYLSGLLHFLCCLLELFPFITAMRRLSSIWETVSVGQKVKCDGFCLIHLLDQKGKYKLTVLPSAGQRWLLQTAEGSNFFIIFFLFTNQ